MKMRREREKGGERYLSYYIYRVFQKSYDKLM
jgi:hypothetical protein